jgi:anti-sigma regulatory factor (Ser/Thr protein kinase)
VAAAQDCDSDVVTSGFRAGPAAGPCRGHCSLRVPPLLDILERKIFPRVPSSVGEVRRFLRDLLGTDHPALDRIEVCASELVTNCILHTDSGKGGHVLVAVHVRADRLRVYVVDEGGASTEPQVRRSGFTESGHGLHIVEELADGWRTQLEDEGRTTWFDIAL